MSLNPRLTLIGLYKYDPAVFMNLSLPAAVDEEIFIDSLMLEYGECPLIYPDLDFMKLAIGAWSRKWYANIERIAAAITAEYNPLHNYDRTETWTENEEGNKDFTRGIVDGESATENQTINETGNITENGRTVENESGTENTTESESGNDENLVSAYNEDDYQPSTKTTYERENERETETGKDKTTTDNKTTATTKATTANKANRNDRSTDETYEETNGRQNTKSGRAYGNIGVTTSTEMLQREIDIRRTENLYHIIAELFYKEFCLYVF